LSDDSIEERENLANSSDATNLIIDVIVSCYSSRVKNDVVMSSEDLETRHASETSHAIAGIANTESQLIQPVEVDNKSNDTDLYNIDANDTSNIDVELKPLAMGSQPTVTVNDSIAEELMSVSSNDSIDAARLKRRQSTMRSRITKRRNTVRPIGNVNDENSEDSFDFDNDSNDDDVSSDEEGI